MTLITCKEEEHIFETAARMRYSSEFSLIGEDARRDPLEKKFC